MATHLAHHRIPTGQFHGLAKSGLIRSNCLMTGLSTGSPILHVRETARGGWLPGLAGSTAAIFDGRTMTQASVE